MGESETRVHFRVIRFIHEAGLRLHVASVPMASACVIYHKFFHEYSVKDFDPYAKFPCGLQESIVKEFTVDIRLATWSGCEKVQSDFQIGQLIASTALFLAGKIEEEHLKLRDVINVCYKVLHRRKAPLELGEIYTSLQESVASCELLVLRCLKFQVVFVHPHKFLLHYLKSLQNWFPQEEWEQFPIASTSWALLRDSYHGDLCLSFAPEHIAVSVLYLALLSYGVEVPYNKYAETAWWKALNGSITLDIIHDIIKQLFAIYDMETSLVTS